MAGNCFLHLKVCLGLSLHPAVLLLWAAGNALAPGVFGDEEREIAQGGFCCFCAGGKNWLQWSGLLIFLIIKNNELSKGQFPVKGGSCWSNPGICFSYWYKILSHWSWSWVGVCLWWKNILYSLWFLMGCSICSILLFIKYFIGLEINSWSWGLPVCLYKESHSDGAEV